MAPGILVDDHPHAGIPTVSKAETERDNYGSYHPIDPAELKLESNFGPMHSDQIGYLQPTSKETPIEVMRERYFKDGYLHVRVLRDLRLLLVLIFWCSGERATTKRTSPRMQTRLFSTYVTVRSAQAGH